MSLRCANWEPLLRSTSGVLAGKCQPYASLGRTILSLRPMAGYMQTVLIGCRMWSGRPEGSRSPSRQENPPQDPIGEPADSRNKILCRSYTPSLARSNERSMDLAEESTAANSRSRRCRKSIAAAPSVRSLGSWNSACILDRWRGEWRARVRTSVRSNRSGLVRQPSI